MRNSSHPLLPVFGTARFSFCWHDAASIFTLVLYSSNFPSVACLVPSQWPKTENAFPRLRTRQPRIPSGPLRHRASLFVEPIEHTLHLSNRSAW